MRKDKLPIGTQFSGTLLSCKRNLTRLHQSQYKQIVSDLIAKHNFTELGNYYHTFKDSSGITGVIALAESHVAFHTWPEFDYVTLDVFVCNYRKDNSKQAESLFDELANYFKPSRIKKEKLVK